MKKANIMCLAVFLALVWIAAGCSKKTPAEPGPLFTKTITPTITQSPSAPPTFTITRTATVSPTSTVTDTDTPTFTVTDTSTYTPTFTVTATATCTVTPDAGSMSFPFEGGSLYGWVNDAGSPATLYIYPSAAQSHDGTGSLGISCAYSAGNDLVRIMMSFDGHPVNLSGKNLSFFVYLSSAMLAAGTFHPEAKLVNYDGTALPLTNGPDMTVPGWNQAVFSVPAAPEYEMIEYVYMGLKDDSGGSYNGYLYIDDISW